MCNKGFTLLETLFVLMIMSVVLSIVAHYGYQNHQQWLVRQQVQQFILHIQQIESSSFTEPSTVTLIAGSGNYQLTYQKHEHMIQENKVLKENGFFKLDKDKKLFFNRGKINQPYTINIQFGNKIYRIVFQMEYGRVSYSET